MHGSMRLVPIALLCLIVSSCSGSGPEARIEVASPSGEAAGSSVEVSGSTSEADPLCQLFQELEVADQSIGRLITSSAISRAPFEVEWRHIVGRLRLLTNARLAAPWGYELGFATLILERAEVGLRRDAWTEEEQSAGRTLQAIAQDECGVPLEGGFLSSATPD